MSWASFQLCHSQEGLGWLGCSTPATRAMFCIDNKHGQQQHTQVVLSQTVKRFTWSDFVGCQSVQAGYGITSHFCTMTTKVEAVDGLPLGLRLMLRLRLNLGLGLTWAQLRLKFIIASGHIHLQVELVSMQLKKNSVQLCNTVFGLCSCIFSQTGSHRAYQDGQKWFSVRRTSHTGEFIFCCSKTLTGACKWYTKQWI